MSTKKALYLAPLTVLLAMLAACQPTPEERLEKARTYVDGADFRAATIELRNLLQAQPDNVEARLLMARSAWQLGDAATAATHYEKALAGGATRTEVWVGYGRALLAQGRAGFVLESVVPNLPEDLPDEAAQAFLGDVYFALGNLDAAAARYASAVAMNQESARGLVGQGMVAAVRGELEAADRLFFRAADLNSGSALVWLAKGNFERAQSRLDAAIDSYQRAITFENAETTPPDRIAVRTNLVAALIDAARYDEAARWQTELAIEFPGSPAVEYLAGRLAFARGDYSEARELLQQYSGKYPDDLRAHAMLGIINFSRGSLSQAEFHLMQAVRGKAANATIRRLLAETQLRLNQPDAALQVLEASGETDSLSLAMLGRAQMAAGDAEEAIRYFEQSIEADPQNSLVGLALATTYISAGRSGSAVDLLKSLPESEDGSLRRETLLITALLRDGRVSEAVNEGERLLQEHPDSADVRVAVGALRYSLKDEEGARRHFEEALAIDPGNAAALFSLSRIALANGDFGESERRLTSLLEEQPAQVPALLSLATVLERQDRLEEMPGHLERAIEAAPEAAAPRTILARTQLALGRPDAAMAVVDGAGEALADAPEMDHIRGLVHLARDEVQQALPFLAKAVSGDPRNAAFRFDLALAQIAGEQFSSAFDSGRAFLSMRPADFRGLSLVVSAAIRAGIPDRARPSVAAFAEAHPRQRGISGLRGDLEMAAGNPEQAAEHYRAATDEEWTRANVLRLSGALRAVGDREAVRPIERWLAEHPDDDNMRLAYAQTLIALGARAEARQQYETMQESGELDALALNNLAWLYAQEGDERAVSLAERAHALAPDNPQVADTFAWILAGRGETGRALELLRRAAEQMPDNPEIAYHLASVLADGGRDEEARRIVQRLLASPRPFDSRAAAEDLAAELR